MQGFIEPNEVQADVFDDTINGASIPSEIKAWLFDMASSKRMASSFEEDDLDPMALFKDEFPKFIESFNQTEIGWEDQAAFKCRFLFGNRWLPLDFFDAAKILSEKNKLIDELFMPLPSGKGGIFKPWVVKTLTLPPIVENEGFEKKYRQKLQELRRSSCQKERVRCYLELQNFSGSGHEEQPPSWREIDRIIGEGPYPLNLVREMEEINEEMRGFPLFTFPRILLLPFLVYGRDTYIAVRSALDMIGLALWVDNGIGRSLVNDKSTAGLTIPKWSDTNHLHWIFFDLAAVSGDYSILDKVLEDVDAADIPYIFLEYLSRKKSSGALYSILIYECIDLLGLEAENYYKTTGYLNWLSSQFAMPDGDACTFFRNYLLKIVEKNPADKATLFRELFYPTKHGGSGYGSFPKSDFHDFYGRTIEETLRYIFGQAQWPKEERKEKEYLEWRAEFVDIIAHGMAAPAYHAKDVLPMEECRRFRPDMIYLGTKLGQWDLDVFSSYVVKKKTHNQDEAVVIAEYWFSRQCYPEMGDVLISIFPRITEQVYRHMFFPNIDDAGFVCRFLLAIVSRLNNHVSKIAGHMQAMAIHLSCWMLKLDTYPLDSDHMSRAMDKILRKEVPFPNVIAELIRTNRDLILRFADSFNLDEFSEECCIFLCAAYIATNNGIEDDDAIFTTTRNRKSQYKFLRIQYLYRHEEVIPEQFMEHLFLRKPKQVFFLDNPDLYPLEMLQHASEAGDIPKSAVIKKLNAFIRANTTPDDELEHRFSLRRKIQPQLKYFLEPGDPECIEAQTEFFAADFAHVVEEANETDNSFKELYSFLGWWNPLEIRRVSFYKGMENLLDKNPEWVQFLTDRCSKVLNSLSKTVDGDFPNGARTGYSEKEHLFFPARFLGQEMDLWKGLKPLLTAFRASRIPMLGEKLRCAPPYSFTDLPSEIVCFFHTKDTDKLRQLRRDMANDLVDKLKPIAKNKKERNPESYTEFDKAGEGFCTTYVEPSPIWRYAYVRALRDLGVKTDARGHFFHKALERMADESQGDPSEAVRRAAKRTGEELDGLRKGIAGGDSKKRLYETFWWLRQAHMLSLGEKIDLEAARMTRIKEWRDATFYWQDATSYYGI